MSLNSCPTSDLLMLFKSDLFILRAWYFDVSTVDGEKSEVFGASFCIDFVSHCVSIV